MGGVAQPSANQNRQELPKKDYVSYHRVAAQAEEQIANRQYDQALAHYRQLFTEYDVSFVRQYQIATQLALFVGRIDDAFTYLNEGIKAGWDVKSIRKNRFLRKLRDDPRWKEVQKQYPAFRAAYQKRINSPLREDVKKMFRNDQRKALGALFAFGPDGQTNYAETKFAPHSERQVRTLTQLIKTHGYPGEKLIGNRFWASVILSHHNSISKAYALKDTLYPHVKPLLLKAIQSGDMSPYEFGLIDGWSISAKTGQPAYGYLTNTLTKPERDEANRLRRTINLSSVETVNQLIDVQEETGINLYIPATPIARHVKKTIVNE